MRDRTKTAVFLSAAIGVLLAAPFARADTAVLPQSDSLPWSDPNHQSPLEMLDSQIASDIAKRPVRSYCNGETDWNALGASREFDAGGVGGFVDVPRYYHSNTRTFYDSSTAEQLSPRACWYLSRYAMAAAKPTKCQTYATREVTTSTTVSYRAKVRTRVRTRVKVKGRWVLRSRWVTKTVTKTKQVPKVSTTQVPGPMSPCYGLTSAVPAVGWSEYGNYVLALLVLAHESVHLLDLQSGHPIDLPFEARAQCLGMQLVPYVATKLGATADDAAATARYAFDRIYPSYEGTEYWSADCRQDGSLDLSPGDGIWP